MKTKYIYPYRYKRGRSRVMEFLKDETKRSIFFLLLGGLSLLVSFFEPVKLPFDARLGGGIMLRSADY